ncbi:hypothetical protein ABL78_7522 [Leptomonas seymouri]|uniref:REH2 DRSM domain-containing protein n=1 Tax=Leptomonas seymouri TaxID=5684 RepID=A0A0N0P2W5_LEPSE|nr:hypothetical protein ABL78_7522 [Leptomonas seymouri]|eukprot:KPI83436.1 hypothetical protein ABL78_7522 [Leptomonas seymouri]
MKTVINRVCALRATPLCTVPWSCAFRRLHLQVESDTCGAAFWHAHRTLHTHSAASSSSAANGHLNRSADADAADHAGDAVPADLSFTTKSSTHTPQKLLFLPAADSFAQSRIKNYVKRIMATPAPEGTAAASASGKGKHSSASTASFSVADALPRKLTTEEKKRYAAAAELLPVWISSFELPVDVFVNDRLTRRYITATGFAAEAKTSAIAACMHAERCLDALRIPIFTSQQRQHQRVLQAQAEGRTAAEVADVPYEMSQVVLPAPVCLPPGASAQSTHRLSSYQPKCVQNVHSTVGGTAAAGPASSASAEGRARRDSGTAGGRRPLPHRPAAAGRHQRRCDNYTTRYSGDLFVNTPLNELAVLQSMPFAHNRPSEGEEDDFYGVQEADSVQITAEEVSILQPEMLPPVDTLGAAPVNSERAVPSRPPFAQGAHTVMLQREMQHQSKGSGPARLDETEGGLYDLVEGAPGDWYMDREVPGAWCLRDAGAVARIDQYLRRVSGHSFKDSVRVHFTDEDTFQFLERKSRYGVEQKRWYTATLDLTEIGVCATGKGTTQMAAFDLCAMHAERLLQWFGVHLYTNQSAQALYYDACLKWGRQMAAARIDPSTMNMTTARLPKPMKEWFRNTKSRQRCSERNVMEKLLVLNRAIVHIYRKHLIEGDLFSTDKYVELFSLVEPCVRSFMVAMQHPFESAYFNLVYQEGSQYRTTIYLPLPQCYGIRGGYAIGATPLHGIQLCALNAVDVLCALDVIPPVCMAQPQWQRLMELRESLGMMLPPSYVYKKRLESATTDAARAAVGPPPPPPHPQLRSPPGYRETSGLSVTIPRHEDVWRIMLMDADVFDVVPSKEELTESCKQHSEGEYLLLPQTFFEEALAHLFQLSPERQEHHRYMFHYTGVQRHQQFAKVAANNFWMELPLDRAIYGRRVAVGRCHCRRGAERMMYIHALRIFRTLKVAPWDTLDRQELSRALYKASLFQANKRVHQWRWLCAAVLDGCADGEGGPQKLSIPEAEITLEVVTNCAKQMAAVAGMKDALGFADMTHALSPHPVMSRELAVNTLC